MPNRVIIMRGVPGSGKSTMAKYLGSVSGKPGDEFWMENKILYYGRPPLALKRAEAADLWARTRISHETDESLYGREPAIYSAIHSTDQYFVNADGTYEFYPRGLFLNHSKNYKAFCDSINSSVPLVIVDNTNTRRKEYGKYLKYAHDNGYWVSFHVMPHPTPEEAFLRNTHGVPMSKIEEMIKRFQ